MEKDESIIDNTKIIKMPVIDEMKKSFISYAMAVNVSRAIPDVRDGLKPVHRRILYSMSELGLYNDKPYRKCARIVGDVLGKYHPHGDSAVYEALVRLAQDFSIRAPLVDGHGNFGSIDGDPAAAQRYTEARLSKISGEMLRDIEKESIDYYPNFDGTLQQPTVLPSRFPNLLVNGSEGIAVGMATSIPPHNLGEVIDGVVALIANPDIEIDELMNSIPAPDYPTGGIIMGRLGVRQAYKTGTGKVIIRSKAEIVEENGRASIVVTEIPYQVNKARLIMNIAEQVKDKKLEGISDIKEESDRTGMRIVIDVKRDANAQVVLNSLYKHTQLQTSNGIIFLSLVNNEPKILNLKEMLHYYLEHQKQIIVRRTKFDLEKAKEREHIVKGLVIALASIDEVIKVIKASKEKNDAAEKLMANFKLSEKQAVAILEMRLQRLTALEVEKLKEELAELTKLIAELEFILATPAKVLQIINTELTEIRQKYTSPRRTEISHSIGDIDIEDLIDQHDVVISLTNQGYVKRQAVCEYKSQHRGGMGVAAHKTKEEDFVNNMFVCSSHDDLLFFTSKGRVYSVKAYEVPEAARQAKGRAIINLLQLEHGERATAVIPLVKSAAEGALIMATRRGLIKKTPLSEFALIRKVGKIAIKLNDDDELIGVEVVTGSSEVLMAACSGKCIRFSEIRVRSMGRTAQGVKSMRLAADDYIVDMCVLRDGMEILTISENGYGKRSSPEDYRLQSRNGMGIKAGVFNAQTGRLVSIKQVTPEHDILLIADSGTIIRISAASISKISRNTKGVRIMKLKDTAKIVSVAITEAEPAEVEPAAE
ncbi:MAG: DNA gyrase subunit A [Firmicutes bacterium]|nr:DNA gyrase subunit A [Bacillota bacterium]